VIRAELVTFGASAQGAGYLGRFRDSSLDRTGFLSASVVAWGFLELAGSSSAVYSSGVIGPRCPPGVSVFNAAMIWR
jgi:hypothetical protein